MINEFKDLNSFKDEMKGWLKYDNDDGPCCCGAWHKKDDPKISKEYIEWLHFKWSLNELKFKGAAPPIMYYVEPGQDHIVAEVRNDLLSRSEVGIKKYGVTLDRKDLGLKEWMQMAYEECLDQALYLKRAIKEL